MQPGFRLTGKPGKTAGFQNRKIGFVHTQKQVLAVLISASLKTAQKSVQKYILLGFYTNHTNRICNPNSCFKVPSQSSLYRYYLLLN